MTNSAIKELFDLSGRVALVTGGGTHLGKAFAESLSELGATVYIASRRSEVCEETANELSKRGLKVHSETVDARDEASVRSLVERIVEKSGTLDIAVANAGGHQTRSHPPHGKISEFVAAFEMNTLATYITAQEAAKIMIPKKRGAIITLGSIAAQLAMDPRTYNKEFLRSGAPYISAKAGVLNLTRALAAEFGPHGITVNCISPGQIPNDETNKEMVEKFRNMNALHRTGLAEDVKGAVALLASDAGKWITGQEIRVDGGWSIW